MKTSIDIRKYRHIHGNRVDMGTFCETFETVEDARKRISDLRDEANDGKYDDCEFEIVRLCDELDSDDYCKVVEVVECL